MDIVQKALKSIKRVGGYLKDVKEQPPPAQPKSPMKMSKPLMAGAGFTTEGASSSGSGPVAAAKGKSGKSGG